jgi:hypothetical protein
MGSCEHEPSAFKKGGLFLNKSMDLCVSGSMGGWV